MTVPNSPSPLPEQRRLRVERLRSLSRVMDRAVTIPGTDFGIGLDPIVGVLTGGGDIVTGLLSAYIVWEAAQMGLPRATLLRMLSNVAWDVLLGLVPVLGDVFDVVWQANARNVELLERHLDTPVSSERADRGFAIAIVTAIVLLVLLVAGFSLWVVSRLIQLLSAAG